MPPMNPKKIAILKDRVDADFLPFVRRPARYIGGEVNQIGKDLDKCDMRIALCFPDVYEIGISYTGMAVLYDILNRQPSTAAERVYCPWVDAEEILRQKNIPLYTLESKAAVKDFDILGFSLTAELCFTNMLAVLDLSKITLRTADRTEDDPIVIAGGAISNCAEPVSPFIDIFILGDGEEAIVRIVELIRDMKSRRAGRDEIMAAAAKKFSFAYVPSLYTFEYDGDKIKSFNSTIEGLPTEFKNAVIEDFDKAPAPETPIVPFAEAVHERISIEIMRGCPGRCRFCQASFCKRPLRYRSVDTIFELAKRNYEATGFDTIGLLSLSTGDYPHLEELVTKLKKYFGPKHVGVSLPSLRVKDTLKLLPSFATSVRKSGLTIAVEAASEKLRKMINKPLTDEDLLAGIEAAYEEGFKRVKLYFMVGFPGETADDISQIVDLSHKISNLKRKFDNRAAEVSAAVSWLVPKPHTPFGWIGQKSTEYFHNARKIILDRKHAINARQVRFKFHNIESSSLESAFARGDRRLADVIETAYKLGARFDLWDEMFDHRIWQQAFDTHNIDPETASGRSFDVDEILPWQHLGGPKKKHLIQHLEEAMELVSK